MCLEPEYNKQLQYTTQYKCSPLRRSGRSARQLTPFYFTDWRFVNKVSAGWQHCCAGDLFSDKLTCFNNYRQRFNIANLPLRIARRIIGIDLPDLHEIFKDRSRTRARKIVADPTHPAYSFFLRGSDSAVWAAMA